ncbi:MAG: FG-GAP-like repeat-containing protein, partial [Planctomycetota bacterium]
MFRTTFAFVLASFAIVSIVSLTGCSSSEDPVPAPGGELADLPAISSEPLNELSVGNSAKMFTELSIEETGIEFGNRLDPENVREYLVNGSGLCTGDFDNDNLVDVYVISQDGPNRLYRQVSPWKFEDVTESAGNVDGGDYWGSGATFADIDGDGFLDLYVCNVDGPNYMYMNSGDGTFVDEAKARNLDDRGVTFMASFADYDNDGDLDVYLLNNRLFRLHEEVEDPKVITGPDGVMRPHPDMVEQLWFLEGRAQEAGQADNLLRNDNGKFVDVSKESGISGYDMGLSATWWDYDDDGWLDLYVGNDFKCPDHLYRNLGNGKFEDVITEVTTHTPWFSMGADSGDVNNDGLIDFLIVDMSSTTHYKQKTTMGEMGSSAWFLTSGNPRQFMRNTFYLNTGTSRFLEIANLSGLDSTDWTWSVKLADQDCDGLLDAFFTNGVAKNLNDSDLQRELDRMVDEGDDEGAKNQILEMPPLEETNLFFRNNGDLKFENVAESWGADDFGVSNGCSIADIDRDGDLDLLVSHMNRPLGVYRNDCDSGSRILIRLNGIQSNRFGIGAKVIVDAGNGTQVQQLALSRGYKSADEPLVHFGLGDCEQIPKLTVEWPSGVVQEFTDLDVNQFYTITEKGEPSRTNEVTEPIIPLFREVAAEYGIDHIHKEYEVDDYEFQPLLPNKLTQLGTGIAWADINGDGVQDCFLGNGSGIPARMYVGSGAGEFSMHDGPWTDHAFHEDMGAHFMDFDSDGDQDLYVVSGGYEQENGDETLSDRLYVNDGEGGFTHAEDGVIPDNLSAGSCVCSCDFDRDGDLDLFIGTRVLPQLWPVPATSRLWRNDDGKFVDATQISARGLTDIGLVTSAIWSDADGDGWQDLFVTLEWGNVKMFKNNEGSLVDATEYAGLDKDLGWWNSIAGGDIDGDGDIDYVAMNTGLNTKYHADYSHPVQLYASDFDNNGRIDLVESEWEGDVCYPIRGRSCSSHAMPQIADQFSTYHEFALADLVDIYSEEALDQAMKFVANNLESVLLINDGEGKFEVRSLPRLAQISPGFGVTIEDVNLDGHADICVAQNFMSPQPETGQMDGGLGLVMLGDGAGNFEPLGPAQSGIMVPGQGMGLTVIDVNKDAAPDLLMTVNDRPTRLFLNEASSDRSRFVLQLDGGNGNLTGIGAQVEVVTSGDRKIVREVYSNSGYLSQSAGELFFSLDGDETVQSFNIRWAD